jgi:hypothetical protein
MEGYPVKLPKLPAGLLVAALLMVPVASHATGPDKKPASADSQSASNGDGGQHPACLYDANGKPTNTPCIGTRANDKGQVRTR